MYGAVRPRACVDVRHRAQCERGTNDQGSYRFTKVTKMFDICCLLYKGMWSVLSLRTMF